MHSAFNYTQYVQSKEISKNNYILYKKCTDDRKSNISLRVNEKKLMNQSGNKYHRTAREVRDWREEHKLDNTENSSVKNQQHLLKNHRSSPINKMTNF